MKTKEIIQEAPPYQHAGEYKQGVDTKQRGYTSDSSLSRLYNFFGEVSLTSTEKARLYFHKSTFMVIGVISDKKPIGNTTQDSNGIIFQLIFKKTPTIVNYPEGISKTLVRQVDSVSVDPLYEGRGIAAYAYAQMIHHGYIIVSDTSQFTDGLELWKKMAREAHAEPYKIYIIDDETGFLKDKNGKIIQYDGSNISDSKIWTTGQDYSGEHILLIAK